MTEKEKAAADVATIGSGTEEQKREQAIILPNKKYIMRSERLQGRTKRRGDIVGERPGLIPDGYGDVTSNDTVSQEQEICNTKSNGTSSLHDTDAVCKQLAKLAGAAGARDLRLMVERERKNGALILSSVRGRGGYYLPACGDKGKAELRAFDRRITACIKSLVIMLHPVRKALKEMEDGEYGKEQGRTTDMV